MKIVFSPNSLLEFKDSIKFYESRRKGLGKRFSNTIKEHLKFIGKNPFASELKYENVRVSPVKKFPFTIHYYYDKENSLIFISAIFHTSQNPKKL